MGPGREAPFHLPPVFLGITARSRLRARRRTAAAAAAAAAAVSGGGGRCAYVRVRQWGCAYGAWEEGDPVSFSWTRFADGGGGGGGGGDKKTEAAAAAWFEHRKKKKVVWSSRKEGGYFSRARSEAIAVRGKGKGGDAARGNGEKTKRRRRRGGKETGDMQHSVGDRTQAHKERALVPHLSVKDEWEGLIYTGTGTWAGKQLLWTGFKFLSFFGHGQAPGHYTPLAVVVVPWSIYCTSQS